MKKGQQHQVAKNYTHGREKVACTVKVDFMDYDMQKDKQPKKKEQNKSNVMANGNIVFSSTPDFPNEPKSYYSHSETSPCAIIGVPSILTHPNKPTSLRYLNTINRVNTRN